MACVMRLTLGRILAGRPDLAPDPVNRNTLVGCVVAAKVAIPQLRATRTQELCVGTRRQTMPKGSLALPRFSPAVRHGQTVEDRYTVPEALTKRSSKMLIFMRLMPLALPVLIFVRRGHWIAPNPKHLRSIR